LTAIVSAKVGCGGVRHGGFGKPKKKERLNIALFFAPDGSFLLMALPCRFRKNVGNFAPSAVRHINRKIIDSGPVRCCPNAGPRDCRPENEGRQRDNRAGALPRLHSFRGRRRKYNIDEDWHAEDDGGGTRPPRTGFVCVKRD